MNTHPISTINIETKTSQVNLNSNNVIQIPISHVSKQIKNTKTFSALHYLNIAMIILAIGVVGIGFGMTMLQLSTFLAVGKLALSKSALIGLFASQAALYMIAIDWLIGHKDKACSLFKKGC